MQESRFDSLTRSMGQSVTRREVLKILAAGVLSAIGVMLGLPQPDEAWGSGAAGAPQAPGPVYLPLIAEDSGKSFLPASPSDLQTFQQEAAADADYQKLKVLIENGGSTVIDTQGVFIQQTGATIARAYVVAYQPTVQQNMDYLVFGANNRDEHIVFSFHYDSNWQAGVGVYCDQDHVPQTEVRDFSKPPGMAPATPASPQALSESCQLCIDTCQQSNRDQQFNCIMRSLFAAIDVGMATKDLLRDTLEDVIETYSNLDAVNGGLGSINECINAQPADCTPSGGMCVEICRGCSTTEGTTCPGNALCIAGDCRQICGNKLCRASETCDGKGNCVPVSKECTDNNYIYMGMYRYGTYLVPACCPMLAATDCGAFPDGRWAGCCPATTLCKPLDAGGYGCCVPGLDC